MTLIDPPWFHSLTGNEYSALPLRRVMQTLGGDKEGVCGATDFAVSASSPASLVVRVAPGRAWVTGDTVARQGNYLIENIAELALPALAAGNATLARRDLIVLRDYDAASDGGGAASDEARIEVVQGTPAASPTTPAVPSNAIALAYVAVAANAASVAAGDIVDLRQPWTADTLPAGMLLPYAIASAPHGYLLCSGQAVRRDRYSRLFNAIGTTFGAGDGVTSFNVPDLRGRVLIAADNLGGTPANRVTAAEADTIGQGGGAETHTLTAAQMPSHTHASLGGAQFGMTQFIAQVAAGADFAAVNTAAGATAATGGGAAHNNVQPYMTMAYLIKA